MKTISTAFNNKITDGQTQQECILINQSSGGYPTGMFSALDGDFTSDGVTIEQTFCESEDLRFGNVGSAQISFDVINERQWMLKDFPWGRMTCYIGVKTESADRGTSFLLNTPDLYIESNAGAYYTVQRHVYYDGPGGLFTVYEAPEGTTFTGLLAYERYLIAIAPGITVLYNYVTEETTTITPTRHMANKLQKGVCYSFDKVGGSGSGNTNAYMKFTRSTLVDEASGTWRLDTYTMANCGRFEVTKPDSLLDDVVSVTDAHDILGSLDIDATDMINSLTYPTSLKKIAEAAVAVVDDDVTILNPNMTEYTKNISSSPFGSGAYTVRDVLRKVAEALAKNVICDGGGSAFTNTYRLKFVDACKDTFESDESIGWTRIASGTLKIKSYDTGGIKSVRLKKANGTVQTVQVSSFVAHYTDIYEISDNPLIKDVDQGTVVYDALYSYGLDATPWKYTPTALTVICANPLVEMGDRIEVATAESNTSPEYDVYGRATGGTSVNIPVYFPLMYRSLHWQGFCFADYQATGNAHRLVDKDSQAYQSSIAMDYTDSVADTVLSSVSTDFVANVDNGIVNMVPAIYQSEMGGTSQVINGVTWTVHSDGRITTSGTATGGNSVFYLTGYTPSDIVPPIPLDPTKKYTLSGGMIGGSSSTFRIGVRATATGATPSSSSGNVYYDEGSDVTIPTGRAYAAVYCIVYDGASAAGLTFYPQLEAGDTAHPFESTHLGIFAFRDNIGKRSTSDEATGVSVPTGTVTNLNSIAIETGHTYVITAHIDYPSNATGRRGLYVSTTSASTSAVNKGAQMTTAAVNGAATRMTCTFIIRSSSITTLYLNGYQNSGGSLTVTSYLDVLRII